MKSKVWVIGAFSIIFLIAAVYCVMTQTKLVSGIFQSKIARVELQEIVTAHPDWGKYQKLQQELTKLQENWANQSGESLQSTFDLEPEKSALDYQMSEIERIYNEEIRLKIGNLNKAIADYLKKRQAQTSASYKEKVKQLNETLNKELTAKSEEMAGKVKQIRSQIQAEYQLELSNLQLQLSMLDMSLNPSDNNQADKEKIQTRINQINREIESKVAAEQTRLQDEFNRFAKEQKENASKEAQAYQSQLSRQLQEDIKQFRQKMETEFNEWQQQRKKELDETLQSRKNKNLAEYKRYSSERLILESEMKQIKEDILWQVKKKAKKLAQAKKVDLIVTGDLAKLKTYDLTTELKKMIQ